MIQNTQEIILKHLSMYPEAEVKDIFKLLFQSVYGCEHMISSPEAVTDYIKKEYAGLSCQNDVLTEPLDGDFSRVHLSYLSEGLSAETFGKLFYLSAPKNNSEPSRLEEKLDAFKVLVSEGRTHFSLEQYNEAFEKWRENGFSPVHHSERFRKCYNPAYRVIHNDFIPFLPLFAKLDGMLEAGKVRLAVEGGSASGKSTLGKILEDVYGCTLFHMDDFFLRPQQRTPERFAQVGGNVDRERFLSEVLVPLSKDETILYTRFDCSSQSFLSPVEVIPGKLVVTEGAYCMHLDLKQYYNYSVFLDISEETQRKRILRRNSPEFAKRFFGEWIPMEKRYFDETDIKNRCDMVISIE